MLTTLTDYWSNDERKKFFALVIKVTLILFGLTLLCVAGGAVLGIPVLSLIFGVDLSGMAMELCFIIIGGGLYAFSTLLYNVLAIFRKQRLMLAACFIVYVLAIVMTKPLILALDLNGAALAYVLCNLALGLLLLACCLIVSRKGKCVDGKS